MVGVAISSVLPAAPGLEDVVEDEVGHLVARAEAFVAVEGPVDAEVDPALGILELGLREAVEGARHDGPDLAVGAPGDAIELVGGEGKGDVVAAVEPGEDLERGGAES